MTITYDPQRVVIPRITDSSAGGTHWGDEQTVEPDVVYFYCVSDLPERKYLLYKLLSANGII